MLMIDAPGRLRCSKTARQVLNVPSRSISMTLLKASWKAFSLGSSWKMGASLIAAKGPMS